jgi:hypothetical protein
MKNVALQLAQFNGLTNWKPQLGDHIVQHGLFTHWFGVVNGIDGNVLSVIKAGLPVLLLTMEESAIPSNTIKLNVSSIKTSRAGKYAIIQHNGADQVWYI